MKAYGRTAVGSKGGDARSATLILGCALVSYIFVGWAITASAATAEIATGVSLVVTAVAIAGVDKMAYAVTVAAVGSMTWNGMRLGASTTYSDALVVVAAALTAVTVAGAASRVRAVVPRWLIWSCLVLAVSAIMTALWSVPLAGKAAQFAAHNSGGPASPSGSNALLATRFVITLIGIPTLVALNATTMRRLWMVLWVWLGGAVLSAAVAVLAAVHFIDLQRVLTRHNYAALFANAGEVPRMTGLTVHPIHLGLASAMCVPVAVSVASHHRGLRRAMGVGVLAILVSGLLVSGSRAAAFGAGVGVLVVIWRNALLRTRTLAVVGLTSAAMALFATFDFGRPALIARLLGSVSAHRSDAGHAAVMLATVHEVIQRPFRGYGFEVVKGGHDLALEIAMAGGLVALAAFVSYVLGVFRTALVRESIDVVLGRALAGAFTVFIVATVFQNSVFDRYIYIPVGLAIALASREITQEGARPVQPKAALVRRASDFCGRSGKLGRSRREAVGLRLRTKGQNFGAVFRSASAILLVRVAGRVLTLGAIVLLARTLGAAEYGRYAYAVGWAAVLVTPAVLGQDVHLVRTVAIRDAGDDRGAIAAAFRRANRVVGGVGGVIIAAGALASTVWLPKALAVPIYIALCLVPVLGLAALRRATLQAMRAVIAAFVPEQLAWPLVFVLLLFLFWVFAPMALTAVSALVLNWVAAALALLLGTLLLRRKLRQCDRGRKHDFTTPPVRLSSVGALALIGLISGATAQVGVIVLGVRGELESAGVFQAAARLADVLMFVLVASNAPFAPLAARLHASGNLNELREITRRTARVCFVMTVPLAIVLVVFSDSLLGMFGGRFSAGAPALVLMSCGQLLNGAAGPVGILLLMTGYERVAAFAFSTGFVIDAILSYCLAPSFGVLGVAIGRTVGIATWNVILVVMTWRLLRVNATALARRRTVNSAPRESPAGRSDMPGRLAGVGGASRGVAVAAAALHDVARKTISRQRLGGPRSAG